MNKHHIHIGSKNLDQGYRRFTQASKRAEKGEIAEPETHLNLEDLSMLTPRRLMFTAFSRPNVILFFRLQKETFWL